MAKSMKGSCIAKAGSKRQRGTKRSGKAASGARQPAARGSQRREQPAAQIAATSGNQRSGASSQRRNLKRNKEAQPGVYGRMLSQRVKTRVPGLFGIRHWVNSEHKEAFIRELNVIKAKKTFQGLTYYSSASNKQQAAEYNRQAKRILEDVRFGSPQVHWRSRRVKNRQRIGKPGVRLPRRVD